MDEFEARYNDGVTARTNPTRVRFTETCLEIYRDVGGLLDTWPGDQVRLVDRKSARGPTRLAVGEDDLARLTIDDPAARAEVLARYPNAARHHRMSANTVKRVAGWSVIGIAGLVFVTWIVIPAAAVQLAAMVPQSVQSRVGERVADQLIRLVALMERKPVKDMVCTNKAGEDALAALTGRLAGHTPPEITYRVRVVDAGLVNAVALPGGHILMTRGILEFVGGPNELTGVLAHEMGHVALNHSVENMIKVGGISALFSLLVGDVAGGAVIIAVSESVVRGSFSQKAERAADGFAVNLLKKAGVDSRPFSKFFERLANKEAKIKGRGRGRVMEWVASHPPSQARADTVLRAATAGEDALAQAQWKALRQICGSRPSP